MDSVPEPTAGPPARPRVTVAELVRYAHERAQYEPIAMADERGCFPAVVLHDVVPMVIDANVLRDEILRTARTGKRTILCNAANSGVFRLFCAEHVVEEVNEHLDKWAVKKSIDVEKARHVWAKTYRPLLRVVDVPAGLNTSEEGDRLRALATPGGPYSDPDDVPTGTLSMLIGAPLLSKDDNVLRAVYGEGFDRTAHKRWLDALAAGGDLGPLGSYMRLMGLAAATPVYLAYVGVRALCRRYPWQAVLSMTAGIGLALAAFLPASRWQRIGAGGWRVVEPALHFYVETAVLEARARAEFASLTAPEPVWRDVVDEIGEARALTRKCLYELARAQDSATTAASLKGKLELSAPRPTSVQQVTRRLRSAPCFVEVQPGRFQLGRALVCRSAVVDNQVAQGDRPERTSPNDAAGRPSQSGGPGPGTTRGPHDAHAPDRRA